MRDSAIFDRFVPGCSARRPPRASHQQAKVIGTLERSSQIGDTDEPNVRRDFSRLRERVNSELVAGDCDKWLAVSFTSDCFNHDPSPVLRSTLSFNSTDVKQRPTRPSAECETGFA